MQRECGKRLWVSVADASGAFALPFGPLLISAAAIVNSSVQVKHSAHIPISPPKNIMSLDCQDLAHTTAKCSQKNRELIVLEETLAQWWVGACA